MADENKKTSKNIWKALYPNTELHKRILKSDDEQESRNRNFATLCRVHGFESWDIDDENGKWQDLCVAIINHVLPGFKSQKPGGRKPKGEHYDYDMFKYIEAISDFSGDEPDSIQKKEAILIAQKKLGHDKDGKIRAALNRHNKLVKENPEKYAEDYSRPHFSEVEDDVD